MEPKKKSSYNIQIKVLWLNVHLDTAYFIENWKLKIKNNEKLLFMLESAVHKPDCTVHVPWTM